MKLLISLWILLFSIISFSNGNSEPVDSKAIKEMEVIIQMRIDDIKNFKSKISNADDSEKKILKSKFGDGVSAYIRSVAIYRSMTGNKLDNKLSKQIDEIDKYLRYSEDVPFRCRNADGSKMDFKPSYSDQGSYILNIESNCPGCYLNFDEIFKNNGETVGVYNTTNFSRTFRILANLEPNGKLKLELFGYPRELMIFFNPQMCCHYNNPSTCVRTKSIILWNDKTKEAKTFSDFDDFNKRSGHKLDCESKPDELTKCTLDNVKVKSDDITNKEKVLYKRNLNAQ